MILSAGEKYLSLDKSLVSGGTREWFAATGTKNIKTETVVLYSPTKIETPLWKIPPLTEHYLEIHRELLGQK